MNANRYHLTETEIIPDPFPFIPAKMPTAEPVRHWRIKRQDGKFAGGEWSDPAMAAIWGCRQVSGYFQVVECDQFGNELPR